MAGGQWAAKRRVKNNAPTGVGVCFLRLSELALNHDTRLNPAVGGTALSGVVGGNGL